MSVPLIFAVVAALVLTTGATPTRSNTLASSSLDEQQLQNIINQLSIHLPSDQIASIKNYLAHKEQVKPQELPLESKTIQNTTHPAGVQNKTLSLWQPAGLNATSQWDLPTNASLSNWQNPQNVSRPLWQWPAGINVTHLNSTRTRNDTNLSLNNSSWPSWELPKNVTRPSWLPANITWPSWHRPGLNGTHHNVSQQWWHHQNASSQSWVRPGLNATQSWSRSQNGSSLRPNNTSWPSWITTNSSSQWVRPGLNGTQSWLRPQNGSSLRPNNTSWPSWITTNSSSQTWVRPGSNGTQSWLRPQNGSSLRPHNSSWPSWITTNSSSQTWVRPGSNGTQSWLRPQNGSSLRPNNTRWSWTSWEQHTNLSRPSENASYPSWHRPSLNATHFNGSWQHASRPSSNTTHGRAFNDAPKQTDDSLIHSSDSRHKRALADNDDDADIQQHQILSIPVIGDQDIADSLTIPISGIDPNRRLSIEFGLKLVQQPDDDES